MNKHFCICLALVILLISVCPSARLTPRVEAQTRAKAASEMIKEWPPSQKRYALIIGVSQYDDSRIYSLKAPSNDAIMIAEALKKYAGFPSDHIVLLASDNPKEMHPTRNIILDYMSTLTRLAGKDGLFLMAFAGHGYELDGQAFLLGSDARLSTDLRVLKDTAVSWSGIMESISSAGVKQTVMLLDACRSDPRSGRSTPKPNRVSQIYSRGIRVNVNKPTPGLETTAVAKLLAAQEGEEAFEDTGKNQGYFMAAIVEGLKGAAADTDGKVTLKSLVEYVKEVVPKRVAIQGLTQMPVDEISYYDSDRLVIAETVPEVATKVRSKVSLFVVTNALEAAVAIKSPDGSLRQEGRVEKGKYSLDVSPGTYDVTVSAARYRPYTGKIVVEAGQAVDFERIDLVPTTGAITLVGAFEPDLNVLVDGKTPASVNKSKSEIELGDISEGRHTVRLSNAANEAWEERIEVKGGATTSFPVIFKRKMVSLTVRSAPGALVYVDGLLRDQVTESGRSRPIEIEPGLRKVRAVSSEYEPVEKAATLSAGAAEVELPLTRKIRTDTPPVTVSRNALFIMRTNVPAANVVIKAQGAVKRQGRSENSEFRAELAPGSYDVAVTAENYLPYTERVTIQEGQPVSFVPVDLVPTTGSITLIGSFEPDVNVLVNGRKPAQAKLLITRKQIEVRDLPAGTHAVQISQPTFATPWEERIEVKGGMTMPVPVAYKPALVNLTVRSEPGTEIYINGTYKGKINESGKTGLIDIPPGEHTIRAVKAEYNVSEQKKVFSAGEATVELKLTRVSFSPEFSDYFLEGLKFWSAPPTWQSNRGRMLVRGAGLGLLQDQIYKDFKMEFDISLANGKGAAWIVRARDQKNYYLFQLSGPKGASPNTFRSFICQDGQVKLLKTDRVVEDISRPDEKFHIIVDARGPTIKHSILLKSAPKSEGAQPLSAMSDGTFSYGSVGFATSGDEEIMVYFVNVTPVN
ncbi:MAG TPA: caspase family protein [Blastocatellia bacterium]|nr:caspase family protein [Blastocatellia bacterium]